MNRVANNYLFDQPVGLEFFRILDMERFRNNTLSRHDATRPVKIPSLSCASCATWRT